MLRLMVKNIAHDRHTRRENISLLMQIPPPPKLMNSGGVIGSKDSERKTNIANTFFDCAPPPDSSHSRGVSLPAIPPCHLPPQLPRIRLRSEAGFEASENVIIGNTCLYGATGGALFANGRAGERFAVRNSMADAVVEASFFDFVLCNLKLEAYRTYIIRPGQLPIALGVLRVAFPKQKGE